MTATPITTPHGTTVSIVHRDDGPVIRLSNPDAPARYRSSTLGTVTTRGYLAIPELPYELGPDVLRAIADILEATHE